MVSWVPFSPASCSTRGRPFPSGAFTAGLAQGEFLGAVRCWSCTVLYCTVLYCTVQVLELCWHGVPGRLCQARQGRPGVQRQQPGQDRAPPRVLDSGGRAGARLEGLRRHRHPRHSPQQGEDCWEREQRGRHRTVRGHGGDGQQVPGGGRAEIEQADVVFSVCTQSPGSTVRPSNSRTGSRFSPTAVLPV